MVNISTGSALLINQFTMISTNRLTSREPFFSPSMITALALKSRAKAQIQGRLR